MKKKIGATAVFVLIFAVCFALADGITGKWAGMLKLPDNSTISLNYAFKADSDKLTGIAVMPPQGEVSITDGMINGNEFSFNVPVPNGNAPHTGKLYGDSIVLHIVYKGQHLQATLKRSN